MSANRVGALLWLDRATSRGGRGAPIPEALSAVVHALLDIADAIREQSPTDKLAQAIIDGRVDFNAWPLGVRVEPQPTMHEAPF